MKSTVFSIRHAIPSTTVAAATGVHCITASHLATAAAAKSTSHPRPPPTRAVEGEGGGTGADPGEKRTGAEISRDGAEVAELAGGERGDEPPPQRQMRCKGTWEAIDK
ncbi:hypothetical protein GW17_00014288 [Ensete ventricosum]|nr:hypothetical protein GW17_00014288 [Ensete ventricosum]